MKKISPVKAIRAKCLDCSYDQPSEVRDCHLTDCALWPFRMGKNPFYDTSKMKGNAEHLKRWKEENSRSSQGENDKKGHSEG